METQINIKLEWPSFRDDVSDAISDEILSAVRVEARKHSKAIREAVAKALDSRKKDLIAKAVDAALRIHP